MRRLLLLTILTFLARGVLAQEPRPVHLGRIEDPEGVGLDFAWRYAPGDDPARAAVDFDDSAWRPVQPALRVRELPRDWTGTAWFRRHLVLEPYLQRTPIVIRFSAPGVGEVYADGKLVARSGTPAAEAGGAHADSAIVRLEGADHVLAVRYHYPGPPRGERIGFELVLADPALRPQRASDPRVLLHAVLVGIPAFLVFLHLALFAFDRKSRENLFYAVQMAAFAVIVLNDSRSVLIESEAIRARVSAISAGTPIVAILFCLLTYYAVRLRRYPRPTMPFVAAGVILFAGAYASDVLRSYGWMIYFAAVLIEVVRCGQTSAPLGPGPQRIFAATFSLTGVAIALQIAVNLGAIRSVGGFFDVYIFGIVASAAGMSLYLADTLGESRVVEAENARKSEELARARLLQLSMLPREVPRVEGLTIAAATRTAAEVGGDYYDFRTADDGSLLLAFGDSTGHGLPAGIVLTAAKALFMSCRTDAAPGTLLREFNRALGRMRVRPHLMSLTLARVTAGTITTGSAGMPPPLVFRSSLRRAAELGAGGPPLGTSLPERWTEATAELASGDAVLFASDGLAELTDASGEAFGYDRVREVFVEAAQGTSAEAIVESLLQTVSSFRGSRALDDDLTLVVIRAV